MAFNRVSKSRILAGPGFNPIVKRIKITTTPPDGDEIDSGYDLPSKAVVLNVFLNVTTAESTGATKTLDVGTLTGETGADPNGFLAAADVSSTGLVKGTLASGGQTLGALLTADEGGTGELVPEPYLSDANTAKSVSYTAGSADWAEFKGEIYIYYIHI